MNNGLPIIASGGWGEKLLLRKMVAQQTFCLLVLFALITGCSRTDRSGVPAYYASSDHSSGVIVFQDSIKVAAPVFVSGLTMDTREMLPGTILELPHPFSHYDISLEWFPDSTIIQVGEARYATYRMEMKRTRWDSIIIRQRVVSRPSAIISMIRIDQSGKVEISGKWKKGWRDCSPILKLSNESLLTELDYLSTKTFDVVFSGDSDSLTYLTVEKCVGGNCDLFEGDEIAVNYFLLQRFLGSPGEFLGCGG